jgi:hypothetical protein
MLLLIFAAWTLFGTFLVFTLKGRVGRHRRRLKLACVAVALPALLPVMMALACALWFMAKLLDWLEEQDLPRTNPYLAEEMGWAPSQGELS